MEETRKDIAKKNFPQKWQAQSISLKNISKIKELIIPKPVFKFLTTDIDSFSSNFTNLL